MSFAVHVEAKAVDLTRAIRREFRALDPALPIYDIKSMDQRVGESVLAGSGCLWSADTPG